MESKYLKSSQAWWPEPVILALRQLRQVGNKFKDSLGYMVSSMLVLSYIVGSGL